MNNVRIRRFTAYCIDLLIITLITVGLFQIKALHPKYDEYNDAYEEYTSYITAVNEAGNKDSKKEAFLITYFSDTVIEDDLKNLEKSINKIDTVTDTKLVTLEDVEEPEDDKILQNIKDYFNEHESLSAFVITIEDSKEVEKVTKEINKIEAIDEVVEYQDKDAEDIKPLSEMSDKEREAYLEKAGSLLRKVDYYGISFNVCWLVVVLLYFTLFPFFNKGMTLGKRVVKLQMVRSDDESKKVGLWQYFVKAFLCPIYGTGVLSNTLTFIVTIVTPLLLDGATFATTSTYINLAICILCYIDFFMIAFRKDGLGISDKLAKVKVTDYVRD